MCDAFSFLEHEASSAHSCLCPRLPWAVQPDIGSLYSTFLGRQHQNKRRGCRERGQGAKPEGRTPAALGRKGEGRTSVWKEGLSALRLPQSTLAGSAWSLSSPQVAFIFPGMFVLLLGGCRCESWPCCVPARKSPQVAWWSSTRAGRAPLWEHLEMHQGHFNGHKDQSTPLPFTGQGCWRGPQWEGQCLPKQRFSCLTCPVKQHPFLTSQRPNFLIYVKWKSR